MKKFLAILMAAMMLLSMATVAMAGGGTGSSDMSAITVTKVYELEGKGTSPAETFTLAEVNPVERTAPEGVSENQIPGLGDITGAEYAEGEAGSANKTKQIRIALPAASEFPKVGVYTYMLKECSNNNAGVEYYTKKIKLVISIVNNGDGTNRIAAVHTEDGFEGTGNAKKDTFTNTYKAGELKISKFVEGNMGDKTEYFKFTIKLSGLNEKNFPNNGFKVTGGTNENNPSYVTPNTSAVYFYLKHGETITIENIPYGVTYEVTEELASNSGYTTVAKIGEAEVETDTDPNGTIGAATTNVTYTNTKNEGVDTGVSLDTLPYVLVLALAGAGLVLMIARKRRVQD